MQVVVFKNIANEKNPSMQLYAQELLKYMPDNVKGFSIDAFNLPVFEHYFTKEFLYPKAAARSQFDVNHISDHSYCGLLRTITPEKTVVTCHDLVPLLYPKTVSKAGRIRYWFNIKLLPKAKRIITGSQFSKKTVIQIFGSGIEDKIRVIPYGVSGIFKSIEQKDALRKKYNIAESSIMHIGGSYKHKNIDIILKFLKVHSEYQFIKIGPLLKAHRRYIKVNRLQKQILHFPYIVPAESYKIAQIYNCVGALVIPSFYEGFGLPILEAAACRCPVACSDIHPFHEATQDAAVFFNPNSLRSLETALEKIFVDENLRNKLIEKGLSIVQKYSWKKCADETYKVYEEVYREVS